jgi:hypothetical protein
MTAHALLASLSGGDLRSIGNSDRVVSRILAEPTLIAVLFQGVQSNDRVLRMRCADAIEKVTAKHPELLRPYKKTILHTLARIEEPEMRWHVAPMLARLPLSKTQEAAVVSTLLSYTHDRSSIVKTMAMQALADIAIRNSHLVPGVKRHIEALLVTGTPAMRARAKKLLAALATAGDR